VQKVRVQKTAMATQPGVAVIVEKSTDEQDERKQPSHVYNDRHH